MNQRGREIKVWLEVHEVDLYPECPRNTLTIGGIRTRGSQRAANGELLNVCGSWFRFEWARPLPGV